MNIDKKLSLIESKIKEPAFLENKGLSNEVGYYVFDYNPEDEMKVRTEIKRLENKINSNDNYGFKVINFDLYEILINILKNKGYLDKVFKFEKMKGRDYTKRAIVSLLKLDSQSNLIINHIIDNTPNNCVMFLSGVGKAYPILRTHNILNNLHQQLDKVPVVLFFPGKYSGRDLVLFNSLEGSNYYRAFPFIQ